MAAGAGATGAVRSTTLATVGAASPGSEGVFTSLGGVASGGVFGSVTGGLTSTGILGFGRSARLIARISTMTNTITATAITAICTGSGKVILGMCILSFSVSGQSRTKP